MYIKKRYQSWFNICFTICGYNGWGVIKWSLFIFSGTFLISYIILDKNRLRCPNCGGYENFDRLMYAKNHVFHCKYCGEKIHIL